MSNMDPQAVYDSQHDRHDFHCLLDPCAWHPAETRMRPLPTYPAVLVETTRRTSSGAYLVESTRRISEATLDHAESRVGLSGSKVEQKDVLHQLYQECLLDVRQTTRSVPRDCLNGAVVVVRVEQWVEPEGWDKPDFPMAQWGGGEQEPMPKRGAES